VTEQLPETEFAPQPEPELAPQPEPELAPLPEGGLLRPPVPQDEAAPDQPVMPAPFEAPAPPEHASGELRVPDGYAVVEGAPSGAGRAVAIVVSRFNGEITGALLESALAALGEEGVARDAVTVMPVPGAFELPIAAMALAKTRRYACIVALGAVIRGETPHFDYVAGEAASGLQLAALETGVPVAFGVLTTDTIEQARERVDKGAEAVRTALEMADVFSRLRGTAAARPA
jgi:6,7-dimethyl-8-ribityllumazine synthase